MTHINTEFPYLLGPTNPWRNALPTEPFSTSVFWVLTKIFATTTKICTRICFIRTHVQDFVTNSTPSYSSMLSIYTDG